MVGLSEVDKFHGNINNESRVFTDILGSWFADIKTSTSFVELSEVDANESDWEKFYCSEGSVFVKQCDYLIFTVNNRRQVFSISFYIQSY